jgi:hypothetical protein
LFQRTSDTLSTGNLPDTQGEDQAIPTVQGKKADWEKVLSFVYVLENPKEGILSLVLMEHIEMFMMAELRTKSNMTV